MRNVCHLSFDNCSASLSKCCEIKSQGHCYMLQKDRKWLPISESYQCINKNIRQNVKDTVLALYIVG